MSRTFPDQFGPKFAELTQEERDLLDKFGVKLKQVDRHLSLAEFQPVDWSTMGVEIMYAKQRRFRLMITFEEVEQIANAEKSPEWFEPAIRACLLELERQQATAVERRALTQQAQFCS